MIGKIIRGVRGQPVDGSETVLSIEPEKYEQRMETCRGCEHYNETFNLCSRCGCYMRWKAQFKFTRCPEGKWQ